MELNISRQDRGLDYKRIEKIVDMLNKKVKQETESNNNAIKKEKQELLQDFIILKNLTPDFEEIESYGNQIDKLEDQISILRDKRNSHKRNISKLIYGSESTYNYDMVNDDSPADKYIKKNLTGNINLNDELKGIINDFEDVIWLAKDIEDAAHLYEFVINQIDNLVKQA